MSQYPRRERKNIKQLCKAVIKYAEGPGEIDSIVNELCDTLASLALAMRDSHERAIEEQAIAEARLENEHRVLLQTPRPLLLNTIREVADERGVDLFDEDTMEDWTELEDIS